MATALCGIDIVRSLAEHVEVNPLWKWIIMQNIEQPEFNLRRWHTTRSEQADE